MNSQNPLYDRYIFGLKSDTTKIDEKNYEDSVLVNYDEGLPIGDTEDNLGLRGNVIELPNIPNGVEVYQNLNNIDTIFKPTSSKSKEKKKIRAKNNYPLNNDNDEIPSSFISSKKIEIIKDTNNGLSYVENLKRSKSEEILLKKELPYISFPNIEYDNSINININDILTIDIDENIDIYNFRLELTKKILNLENYKFNNSSSVLLGRLIVKKLRLGIKYNNEIEEIIDKIIKEINSNKLL